MDAFWRPRSRAVRLVSLIVAVLLLMPMVILPQVQAEDDVAAATADSLPTEQPVEWTEPSDLTDPVGADPPPVVEADLPPVVESTEPVATDPPVEPADSPPAATDAPEPVLPSEEASEVATEPDPEAEPTPPATPGQEPTEAAETFMPAMTMLAMSGSGMTVNGQSGTVQVSSAQPAAFWVGDQIDPYSLSDEFIFGGNPTRDWYTENRFLVYDGTTDCRGSGVPLGLPTRMLPDTAFASYQYPAHAPGGYSVRAEQVLFALLPGSGSQFDGYQRRVTATSNCVGVVVYPANAELTVNGLISLSVNEGEHLWFSVAGPLPAASEVSIRSATRDCAVMGGEVAEGVPGPAGSAQLVHAPLASGTYWFTGLVLAPGGQLIATNCVQVAVRDTPEEFFINSSQGIISVLPGEIIQMYGRGFRPDEQVRVLAYQNTATCGGTTPGGVSGTPAWAYWPRTNQVGEFEVLSRAATVTMSYEAGGICIGLTPGSAIQVLTVNGGSGSFVFGEETEVEFLATGLPAGAQAVTQTCDGDILGDPTGGVASATGTFTGFLVVPFGATSLRIVAGGLATNCVYFEVIDGGVTLDLTVNGGPGPVSVLIGERFDLRASGYPPNAFMELAAFTSSGDCTGTSTSIPGQADPDGVYEVTAAHVASGTQSWEARFGEMLSACVQVVVGEVPPIHLQGNGSDGPVSVLASNPVELVTTGLRPNAEVHLLAYEASWDCTGTLFQQWSGVPEADGTFIQAMDYPGTGIFSVRAVQAGNESNCVELQAGVVLSLLANGEPGPVSVPPNALVEFTALGLAGGEAYGFELFAAPSCTGVTYLIRSGLAPTGGSWVGGFHLLEPGVYSAIAFQGPASSNCVQVQVVEDPVVPSTEPSTMPTEVPTDPAAVDPSVPPTEIPTDPATIPATVEPTSAATDSSDPTPTEPTAVATEPGTGAPTDPATREPLDTSDGAGSQMDVAGVVTESGPVPAGDAGVANLPVTGATATTDRPLFPLLIVAALLFGVAGKVTRMTGRRS